MNYDSKPWLKSYDPDVSPEIQITDKSLLDRFNRVTQQLGGQDAFHFLDMSMTYETLMEKADCFARCLVDHNLKKGDIVAINLPNTPQYLIALIGTLKAGCVVSGLSPLLTPKEMAYQLNDSQAKALVTLDAIFEKRLTEIATDLPHLKLVFPTGLLDFLPKYKQWLARLFKKVPRGQITNLPDKKVLAFKESLFLYPPNAPNVELNQSDACFLQYTGGTTGKPKGALLSHGNALANMFQFEDWAKMELGKDITCSGFPMFHAAGLTLATMSICFGCTQIIIPDPRDTKRISRECARYHPTFMANVPTLYLLLLQDPDFNKLDLSSLRVCISGAAPFPVENIKQFEKIIGSGKIAELYGMTETGPVQTMNPYKGTKKPGSVGLPLQSTMIRIVDLIDGNKQLPIGEEGEIIVSGPQVMKGYFNKPEETSKTLREYDNRIWMHTGDIGRMDEDGYVYIVDRAKDMIIVGGYKVFSREVEEEIFAHPAVEQCAIIGTKNPDRPETEVVKLVIQKSKEYKDKPDQEVQKEILALAKERLSPYKIPKLFEFVEEIPLTHVGKVNKKALRTL
ncbi:MAG: AMP-dependent synthetase/ligase [Candidatus Magnetoglobus multicellularis str. Araruama]|uniref:AMP-dependent synthetase/ligase n=1 Tax=Candidatus Magnetoglobus multicellularis str. Araruama TaxID=890399 RepID=A0A1V1PBF7_9BACT|nr:MAG: AMP-dependent synthetase/ligase [Candidatus Magnetoglobus multicellularis str. Araruama]